MFVGVGWGCGVGLVEFLVGVGWGWLVVTFVGWVQTETDRHADRHTDAECGLRLHYSRRAAYWGTVEVL